VVRGSRAHPAAILPVLIALIALGALTALAPLESAAQSDWPVFHGDARHSGFSNKDAPFDSMLAWSHAGADSIVYSSPVLGLDGTIYVGDLGERLLALSPAGELQWTFEGSSNFRYATPAVADDGTIYIGGADGVLYAVNPDSTLEWTFTAGGAIKTSPNIAPDGRILFGADDGLLYAVHPDSTLDWTYPTGGEIRCSPAVGPDDTIFFGSTDGFFYALWSDGTLRWQAATGDQIKYSSPAVTSTGIVYFGSYDGFVYALTSDQQFLWAYPTEHVVRSSPAIGPDGTIYVGSDNKLLAIDTGGSLVWEYEMGDLVISGGSLVWDYEMGDLVISSPVYFGDDDVIGVGSDDGAFYCITADGTLDWRYTVGAPIRSTPSPSASGHIYAADVTGTVWAFGPEDPIGIAEHAPAPPARTLRIVAAPNPTFGAVTFSVGGEPAPLTAIGIYDVAGREVVTLDGSFRGRVTWDGRDRHGRPLASGTYFYRAMGSALTGRVVLIR
jgi:outer membrane protein assembly factor BamB